MITVEFDYYILVRDNTIGGADYMIVNVPKGNDPLYGYGSWDLFAGPFNSWDDADHIIPEEWRAP